MKKLLALLLVAAVVVCFAACGGKTSPGDPSASDPSASDPASDPSGEEATTLPANIPTGAQTSMRETFNQIEYALYMSIFYDKTGDDYVGDAVEKEGVFATIRDEYNQKDRYYVWGYLDATRCCDYQWEIVPNDVSSLPAPGSTIKVKGTFAKSDDALDGYWIENADVTLVEAYNGPDYDYDGTTMSPTLARVEIANMVRFPEVFNGKTVLLFGRAYNAGCLQHPYYDNSWTLDFVSDETPAVGTYLLLGGTFVAQDGSCYLDVDSYQLAS